MTCFHFELFGHPLFAHAGPARPRGSRSAAASSARSFRCAVERRLPFVGGVAGFLFFAFELDPPGLGAPPAARPVPAFLGDRCADLLPNRPRAGAAFRRAGVWRRPSPPAGRAGPRPLRWPSAFRACCGASLPARSAGRRAADGGFRAARCRRPAPLRGGTARSRGLRVPVPRCCVRVARASERAASSVSSDRRRSAISACSRASDCSRSSRSDADVRQLFPAERADRLRAASKSARSVWCCRRSSCWAASTSCRAFCR